MKKIKKLTPEKILKRVNDIDKQMQKRVKTKLDKQGSIIMDQIEKFGCHVGVKVNCELETIADGYVVFGFCPAEYIHEFVKEKYFTLSLPYSEYLSMNDENFTEFIQQCFKIVFFAEDWGVSCQEAYRMVSTYNYEWIYVSKCNGEIYKL